jgi:hypothetical protein
LQPKGSHSKPYQVKQVRNVIVKYKIIAEWLDTARELGRPIPQAKGRLMYA